MQISRRVDGGSRSARRRCDGLVIDDATVEHCLDRLEAMRPSTSANHADMRIAGPALRVFVVKESDAGQCEIPLPQREFFESPAAGCGPGRQAELGDDLV